MRLRGRRFQIRDAVGWEGMAGCEGKREDEEREESGEVEEGSWHLCYGTRDLRFGCGDRVYRCWDWVVGK